MSKKLPMVWMNVTTSANWSRPPVGIVRVEQALCAGLADLFGAERFRRCVWLDGEFVEWVPGVAEADPISTELMDVIFPKSASFDLARMFVSRAFKLYGKNQTAGRSNKNQEVAISVTKVQPLHPRPGDILISVGLDWDSPASSQFFEISKKRGLRIITCCYDLIPVLFPQYCVGEVAKRFKEYFMQLTWGSSAVLCISEQTRQDYKKLCSDLGAPVRETVIIPLGDNVPGETGNVSREVSTLAAEPFIIFVSTIERRKNHEVLYRAYHLLCRSGYREKLPKLVFVGMPGWGVGDLLKDIELDPETKGLIVQLNHVSDAELNHLYKKALFCVYPSLYEGWGLPVGEALALGKAVIASAQGSLPEVGGDLVRYVPPWHAQAWADAIMELVMSPEKITLMEKNVVDRYSPRLWKDTAIVVKQLVDNITSNPNRSIKLYPGYDMSTLCGYHDGASIVSNGESGILLFGPHRSLAQGNYAVSIIGKVGDENKSNLDIEFVFSGGECALFTSSVTQKDLTRVRKKLIEFQITIDEPVVDYEIRCLVGAGAIIQLDLVEINNID